MDERITQHCPFCGERQHLQLDEGAYERELVRDGLVVDGPDGQDGFAAMEYVDSVHCKVCLCLAALDVWNRTRPAADHAALREWADELAAAA